MQSGWLRASVRKLDTKKSTQLEPVLSLRQRDAAPLPKGKFTKLTIPLYYQGHVYRPGSRIRVTLRAPRGDQPVWAFAESRPTHGHEGDDRARRPRAPSRLLLPVVPGRRRRRPPLPPCPGLRGEPCRTFVP